ncbi:hypothetical protein DE146DRAFT_655608 [Phaeosphaeria sp. MPI-PUGE-AT-0046c]|nr:hypothetical protein DE146DRAFT_655608 [Phaeosphaeria sp. MPI-PUGE-AT-0046c]
MLKTFLVNACPAISCATILPSGSSSATQEVSGSRLRIVAQTATVKVVASISTAAPLPVTAAKSQRNYPQYHLTHQASLRQMKSG